MRTKIMTSAVAGLLLACASLANAAEPVALTDSQMDSVAAGNNGPHFWPWLGWNHHHHHHHHHGFIITPIGFRVIAIVNAGRF